MIMTVMQLLQIETHEYNIIPQNSLLVHYYPHCLSLFLSHFLSIFSHCVSHSISQAFSFTVSHTIFYSLAHPLAHTISLWRSVRVPSAFNHYRIMWWDVNMMNINK